MPGMTSWVSVGGGAFHEEGRAPASNGLALRAVSVIGVPNSNTAVARERAIGAHVVGVLHHICRPQRDFQTNVFPNQVVVVQLRQMPTNGFEVCVFFLSFFNFPWGILGSKARDNGQWSEVALVASATLACTTYFLGIVVAI